MARLAPTIRRLLELPEDERRLGPFRLVEQLGRGGFAPVWLAKEVYGTTELRTAAVKLFSLDAGEGREALGDREAAPLDRTPSSGVARARIVEEARALCQVEHPNVVRFYSLQIDEARGVMGLAMEYVAGVALDKRLAGRGRLPVTEALAVGIAVASALSAVHRAGLVHRDVKPGNVIDAAGVPKLIDFGIAAADALPKKAAARARVVYLDDLPLEVVGSTTSPIEGAVTALGDASSDEPPGGVRGGTVGYIDPVCVATGAPAIPASDLYALGAMLFECLTGVLPAAARAPAGKGLEGEVLDGRLSAPPLTEITDEASVDDGGALGRSTAAPIPPSFARLIDALLAPDRAARPPNAEWVAIQLEQIKNELAGLRRARPPESVGPFRGLGRFEQSDRDVYFGRASEIAAALEMLRSRGVVALIGPSGSGKSSLARAGMLPAIAEGALGGWPRRWDTAVVEPGLDPRAAVARELAALVPDAAELSPEALVVALSARASRTGSGLLLLVDQLEELATLAAGPSQAWLVALLARLGEQAIPGVRAVVAARRDLLDPLLSLGELSRALVRGLVLIEPITEVTWGDVLEQALAAYGYSFEDDALKRELLAGLKGTASAMPLVQFALTQLWNKRDPVRKKVTRAGLVAIGGIAGALERHADGTLAELGRRSPDAPFAAKTVLLALTTPQGTRALLRRQELLRVGGHLGEQVIEAFEQARLIVPGSPAGFGQSPEHGASPHLEQTVTLAHDALLTQWGKLRAWVAEAREDRLLADELEREADKWGADPESVPLWQRRRLAFGEDLARRGLVSISPAAAAFLKQSRRIERRRRWVLAGSLSATLLAIVGVVITYGVAMQEKEEAARSAYNKERVSRQEAERQTRMVQEAQARIDQLLRDLADSESKEAVLDLQRQIRQTPTGEGAEKRPVAPVGPGRSTPGALPPLYPRAAPLPAASTSAPAAPSIKPQTRWD